GPVERHAKVLVFAFERVENRLLVNTAFRHTARLRELGEPMAVALGDCLRLIRALQPFECVFANRFEHPVAIVTAAEHALVDQRSEGIEVGIYDALRRFERAAAAEDPESSEEPLFADAEQVVAPVDRGAEGLLTRIGVTTALQQIEICREPPQELLGPEYSHS